MTDDGPEVAPGARPPARAPVRGDQLERVIQRAAELQFARDDVPEDLTEEEVVRIAGEVGLETRHVRQALAELRANALVPAIPADAGLAARFLGPALVQASRVVPGDPPGVLRELSSHLRERESLRTVREQPGRQLWEPAADLMSKLSRSFDFSGRGYELARCRSLEVSAEPLESGRSLLTLTADLRNQRTEHAVVWLSCLGAAGAGASAALVFGFLAPPLLALPAVGAAVVAAGGYGASRTVARRRARVELALLGILDRLEAGGALGDPKPSLRDRLHGLLEEG
ncbi:MAG: hypothetical protein R6X22_01190 [Gemmatimonadota bacterium]|jgi:hypothetical protein